MPPERWRTVTLSRPFGTPAARRTVFSIAPGVASSGRRDRYYDDYYGGTDGPYYSRGYYGGYTGAATAAITRPILIAAITADGTIVAATRASSGIPITDAA